MPGRRAGPAIVSSSGTRSRRLLCTSPNDHETSPTRDASHIAAITSTGEWVIEITTLSAARGEIARWARPISTSVSTRSRSSGSSARVPTWGPRCCIARASRLTAVSSSSASRLPSTCPDWRRIAEATSRSRELWKRTSSE